jgi:ketosteroid isomerase-like protein
MSQENVEIIRATYDSLRRVANLDWDLVDADATFDARSVPGFGFYRGREAFLAEWLPYRDSFDDWSIVVEGIVDGTDQHVFAVVRDGGRIRGSDDEVFNRYYHVWGLRAGKIAAWAVYLDRSEALKAAGLSE